MTKYQFEIDDLLWSSFKLTVMSRGLKVKEGIVEAVANYIKNHSTKEIKVDVQIIKNNRKNILSFVYEEEIKNLLEGIIEAKKRNAPDKYVSDLKNQILQIAKKHPTLSEELANQIVTVFKNLT